MNGEGELDRSEKPTAHKLSRAREQGSVARGPDIGFLAVLVAVLIWVHLQGVSLFSAFLGVGQRSITEGSQLVSDPDAMIAFLGEIASDLVHPLAILLGTAFLLVLGVEVLQTGFVISTEPLKPDLARLNPVKGLKRLFTIRLLIEALKNIAKLGIYAAVAWYIGGRLVARAAIGVVSAQNLAQTLAQGGIDLVTGLAVAAFAFAAIDQIIVRRDFLRRMRMSRREIKREHRDREGDPRIKQQRRRLHAAFVKQAKSVRGIRNADVLITNPVHFAVGLRYEPARTSAPEIVSLGSHSLALRLRGLALGYSVPVIHDPPLARALFKSGALGAEIPTAQFRAVADIYLRLRDEIARSASNHKSEL